MGTNEKSFPFFAGSSYLFILRKSRQKEKTFSMEKSIGNASVIHCWAPTPRERFIDYYLYTFFSPLAFLAIQSL